MNHVWDDELKPLDLELFNRKLVNGLANPNPISALANSLKQKKTIKIGNKSDPFQDVENKYRVTKRAINILLRMNWSFVIQTKFTANLMSCFDKLVQYPSLVTIMAETSPGLEKDWELFERERTTHPKERMEHLNAFQSRGVNVGINGEPFIPGYHTVEDFEETMKFLKQYRIPSYNTYNLHFNAFVAKRLNAIGVDIERIWFYNQDDQWKKILVQLLELSKRYGIKLGCPDFVNTGWKWIEPANTCCGIDVPNPCTFNSHHFKKCKQDGLSNREIIEKTWDGVGNKDEGISVVDGSIKDKYNLNDIL